MMVSKVRVVKRFADPDAAWKEVYKLERKLRHCQKKWVTVELREPARLPWVVIEVENVRVSK